MRMKIVVAKLVNKELEIVKVPDKCRNIFALIISKRKIKIKASKIYKAFIEVFNTDKVMLKEENCFLFSIFLKGCRSDYYLLKVDENVPYVYYKNDDDKLIFFEDDLYSGYFSESGYKVFSYSKP